MDAETIPPGNSTIGGVFKQESYKVEKNKKKRQDKLQKTKDG